jgi:hypothetical protein
MKQPKKRRRRNGKRQIEFLATMDMIARIDRTAKEYTGKLNAGGGGKVRRADATRYAVTVGLDSIERQLGLPPLEPLLALAPAKRKPSQPGVRAKR